MNSPLSPRDKDLLSSLANPSSDADAVLATLTPDELGPWLERPEIQAAIAAAFELREIRLRFKITAATGRAIDRMTAVLDANKDLADPDQRSETRRAASAIFRVARAFQPVSSLRTHAGAAPGSSGTPSPRSFLRSHFATLPLGHSATASSSVPSVNSVVQSASSALSASSAVSSSPSSLIANRSLPPAEPPLLDTSTPQASIAGVIAAFKQLPSDAPRAALKLIERAIALPIRFQPIYQERFLSHLAASPALTARNRPHRADPIKVEGATATQRITYTLPDGTTAAAFFRATRRDPVPGEHAPPSWRIDAIYPADTG